MGRPRYRRPITTQIPDKATQKIKKTRTYLKTLVSSIISAINRDFYGFSDEFYMGQVLQPSV